MEMITFADVKISTPALSGIQSTIGGTPLLPLARLSEKIPPEVQVLAKAEWFNPGGSVKDRPALNIVRSAISDGSLTPDKRLLDSTSGNMGISYATLGAAMGVGVTLVMPSNASPERIAILRALGAELILSDPLEGSDGAIHTARVLAAGNPNLYFYANQYDNPANWLSHYNSTGPEILDGTSGEITHFVAGMGTSGTITGVTRYLRQQKPSVQTIAVQPDSSLHGLEGLKHMASTINPAIYDSGLPDDTLEISTEAAHEMVRKLAQKEGLFVGVSSGAAAAAALQIAQGLERGVVVTVFPDAGYKYLSDKALWQIEN